MSALSLCDFIKREIKKMIIGIGTNTQGNIHPLIMREVEANIIELVLQETKYNYVVASRILGISRSTLYRKIDTLKIETDKTHKMPTL